METQFEKTYTSFIAVMLPPQFWTNVQPIREKYCGANVKPVPHITLIDPFLKDEHFENAVQKIREELTKLKSFKITLREFSYFKQKNGCTLYLYPLVEPPEALSEVQQAILKVFPYCNDINKISKAGFTPHFTLGRLPSEPETKAFIEKIRKEWKEITFEVKEINIISRIPPNPYAVRKTIPIGDDTTPAHFPDVPLFS